MSKKGAGIEAKNSQKDQKENSDKLYHAISATAQNSATNTLKNTPKVNSFVDVDIDMFN